MARYLLGIDEIKGFVISHVILSQDFSELNVLIFVIPRGNTLMLIPFIYININNFSVSLVNRVHEIR